MNPLLDSSNFVDQDIIEKDVELGDGEMHSLKFKRLSGVEYYAYAQTQHHGDEDQKVKGIARLVSVSLVDDDGNRLLSIEQAMRLKDTVLNNLLAAANQVNRVDSEKKALKPEANVTSGT